MQTDYLALRTRKIGALPIIDRYMAQLELRKLLAAALERETYVDAIELLVKSILVKPNALYRVGEWATLYDPSLVYGAQLSDDVLGRALVRLFEADRASLMTRLIVATIKKFHLDIGQIHNDTTTVKLCGAYVRQNSQAVQLKHGYSKNHRPDLLQLVYSLSVTADGAVPVHFKAYDGNQSDDGTHWETWQTLRGVLGRSDFIYVADSKLCVSEILMKIDRAQGRFVTVLPKTRQESEEFCEKVLLSTVRWERIYSKRSTRKRERKDVFESAQEFYQMREGFRLYWFRSSEKALRDEQGRTFRLATTHDRLKLLNVSSRRGPKTEAALLKAARKILDHYRVKNWFNLGIQVETVEKFRQTRRGKATKNTVFYRIQKKVPKVTWTLNQQALDRDQAMDGIFPLATNTKLSALEVLKTYKYQPKIEKRHSLFKSVLEISPVFLKKNDRIEALIFVYFIAQTIAALIERTIRKKMTEQNISELPVLPENRMSQCPSAAQIMSAFEHRDKHELFERGTFLKTFADPLTSLQKQLLVMLDVSQTRYF